MAALAIELVIGLGGLLLTALWSGAAIAAVSR